MPTTKTAPHDTEESAAPYVLTRQCLDTITDIEMAFGTTKLLPPYEQVPPQFKAGNIYTRTVDCLFSGIDLPNAELTFCAGFDDSEAPAALGRCVNAHLRSWEPKHEHKIAGLGYLISLVCKMHEAPGSNE